MAKSYYSTVFEQSAEQVWAVIRDFNSYPVWFEGVSESHIKDGKAGDAVGAIRDVRLGETDVHHIQRLLAHSDIERAYTYEFCEPFPYPTRNCQMTLCVTPIIDGKRAFVEWWVTFDCEPAEYEHWTHYFAHNVYAKGLESLRSYLESKYPSEQK
ncbi:SRPBCC family protein [Ktedonosporobacter rubrisoli]|uniref:SRPBCC family protein n=1 Tax=Ktedonosporobacter rubrisoli TaxID=2509675 RepID=A0A4P6JHL4_KTERU|nr:SRPBCC family protein [Ktedonosporobacter rubrisoli]QBD74508.1 SRPBCC family protein [Ktedonosporobacter rubrisoli]